ncbi:ribbon-helix-helix protein, CopG family [Vibrio sp. PP-XX7]
MSITSVRLNDEIEKPLDILSKKLDRSRNYIINQAIKEYLAKQSTEDALAGDTRSFGIYQGRENDQGR